MKRMNTKAQWLALGAMAMAVTVFALGSAALWALEPSTPLTPPATPKAGTCEGKATAECKEMGMHGMRNLTEFKKVLANAKALAGNGDVKGVVAEIAKAEVLMSEGHAKLETKMTERRALRDRFFKERLTKLETLLTDIQGINQTLASRPDTKDLSVKLDDIYRNGQLLRDQLTHDGVLAWFRANRIPGTPSPTGVTGPEGKVVPVVNEKCPMTGKVLDREKVPAELRVEFKGKPVGFCCKGCPSEWSKLSDEDKQAKLDKVLPPPPKTETVDPIMNIPPVYPDPLVIPPID